MNLVMEEEVRHLAGERHQQHPAARPPLGERGRLLCGGRAEGADSENPFAQPGKSRATAGQLRVVPAQCAAGSTRCGTR